MGRQVNKINNNYDYNNNKLRYVFKYLVISISVALVYMTVPAVVPNVYQSQEINGEKIYCGCTLTIIINKYIS